MFRAVIAVVDTNQTRFIRLDRKTDANGTSDSLLEEGRILNEHRDDRAADDTYARRAFERMCSLGTGYHANRVVMCAGPRMIGHLRKAAESERGDLDVTELAHDLSHLTASEIRRHLVDAHLLPPR